MENHADDILPLVLIGVGAGVGVFIEKRVEWSFPEKRVPKQEFIRKHPDKALLCHLFISLYLLTFFVVGVGFAALCFPKLDVASHTIMFFFSFFPCATAGAVIGLYEVFFKISPAPAYRSETLFGCGSKARKSGAIRIAIFVISVVVFGLAVRLENYLLVNGKHLFNGLR